MLKHEKEFIVNQSQSKILSDCLKVVSAQEWNIINQQSNGLVITKTLKNSFLLTDALEAYLQVTELTPAFCKITICASNGGLGIINSAQVKEEVESLAEEITKESKQSATTAPQNNPGAAVRHTSPSRHILINSVQLSDQQVNSLEQTSGIPIQDGAYWYDNFSGAWGLQGGPVTGFIRAGLNLGGPLRPDASNGNTGVFINGRQLHMMDVMGLQQFCPVYPGRYWVDAQGNFGYEGGAALGNLRAMSQRSASGSSSGGAWTAKSSTGTVGGDGEGFVYYDGKNGTSWSN